MTNYFSKFYDVHTNKEIYIFYYYNLYYKKISLINAI